MEAKDSAKMCSKDDQWERFRRTIEEFAKENPQGLADVLDSLSQVLRQLQGSEDKGKELSGFTEEEGGSVQGEHKTWEVVEGKPKQSQPPKRIKLDVGGKIFATSLSTLTSVKDTFFDSMFGGERQLSDS